jgi:hypothetical protein
MAQKSQGYVQLYWNCPNCKAQNIGTNTTCTQCGSAQPADVEFYQLESSQLIKDAQEIKRAAAGADIYCPYCSTRNTADQKICTQCGGDIAEGNRRKSGQVLGAFKPGDKQTTVCKACGSENAIDRTTCHQCGAGLGKEASSKPQSTDNKAAKKMGTLPIVLFALGGLLLCIILISVISGLFKKEEIQGTVENVQWLYTVNIERYGAVEKKDWQESIPSDATLLSCEDQFHHEESSYVAGAEEVCGEPYTVDNGNGYAEVVQDCVYRVYQPYCSYQVTDWAADTAYTSSGNDMNPYWPSYSLSSDQRVSDELEQYSITFSSDSREYEYETTDYSEFSGCTPGSIWNLTVNSFNSVLSISPVN